MAASDNITTGGIATYTVKVGGSAIPDESRIYSITIERSTNRIPEAKIVVLDGDASTETFEASSSETFVPGAEVVIEAGYDTKNEQIFKGIITRQSLRVDPMIGSALEIECRDAAIKMVVGRKSLTYSKQKDSDIMSTIIGNYSDLSADVTATTTEWPEQVQYYATDWDFILTRSEANGLIVNVLDGKVSVEAPDANSSSVLTIKYGDNLHEFRGDLNSVSQLGSVKAQAWDYKTQAIISGEASNDVAGAGNLSSKTLSEVVGLSEFDLQTSAYQTSDDLTNWSKAQMIKSEYSKIIGTAVTQGTNLVNPGTYVTLQGLGDRFNGDHYVSGVRHDFSEGNWLTETTVGMSSIWFSEEPDVMAPPAAGLLPGARGLFNGTVKQMYEDPDSQYRILVDVPLFDQNGEGIWARLANFYSTSGAGAFFLPEVGDEVVLGFLSEDPRYPVILGSLYSSDNIKPFDGLDPNEQNSIKAIVSKSGIQVKFDDENKVFTIETPSKNTMILSDEDKQITIQDQNNNSIVMSESGITIKSEKDINIEADQKVSIKGTQGVTVEASGGDVEISGMNIKETADMQYSAEGSETAQVNAGMELTLKGAMVMIN
ncbi:MAG: type VI secretion system tip protein VgrG [Flavobacteriales bacterium]|nr:type VI secretion system tip protein VgrG [Flavobacteriales bacterium]